MDNCLQSIYQNPPTCTFEVILIDNASTDGSYERIKKQYSQITYITERSNLGLAKAFNHGLDIAKGDFLLSLDNDTRVLPGALQLLVDTMQENAGLGMVGSFLLNPDMSLQRTFRRTPSALNAIFGRRSWITRVWPNNPISRKYLMDEKVDEKLPFEVDFISTAALMISRAAYELVGGLDEDYFVYWVDADWCARVRRSELGIVAVPKSKIIHDENLKAKRRTRKSTKMVLDFHKGAYRYYRKNHASFPLHPMAAVAFIGLSLRAIILICSDYIKWRIGTIKSSK